MIPPVGQQTLPCPGMTQTCGNAVCSSHAIGDRCHGDGTELTDSTGLSLNNHNCMSRATRLPCPTTSTNSLLTGGSGATTGHVMASRRPPVDRTMTASSTCTSTSERTPTATARA